MMGIHEGVITIMSVAVNLHDKRESWDSGASGQLMFWQYAEGARPGWITQFVIPTRPPF